MTRHAAPFALRPVRFSHLHHQQHRRRQQHRQFSQQLSSTATANLPMARTKVRNDLFFDLSYDLLTVLSPANRPQVNRRFV